MGWIEHPARHPENPSSSHEVVLEVGGPPVGVALPSEFLSYQLSIVVQWTTMAVTGNGEFGFDSGEGA